MRSNIDIIKAFVQQVEQDRERAEALGDRVARHEAAQSNFNFRNYVDHVVRQLEFDEFNARRRNAK